MEENDFYSIDSEEEDNFYTEDGGNKEPDYAHKHYKILKEEDIRKLQDNDILTVSSVLAVSRGVACTLLCRNNWSLSSVYDEWFADNEIARERPVGILGKRKQVCKICYEKIRSENMVSAACGHPFCADCWKTYITTSINDGPGCLILLCPEPACKATAGLELIDLLASEDDKQMYYRYLYRSYVERNRNRKWCPAPGCNLAIEFDAGGCESYDVTCDCSHMFCWNCTEESHRPVDCKMVTTWIEKNCSEVEITKWIQAFTKPCPKCNRAIEKVRGCNHMTCGSPCGFQFCWVCLRSWKSHANFNYSCKEYKGKGVGRNEKSIMNAKKHLERYTHYYERSDSNDKSRKRALVDLNRARNEYIDMLAKVQGEPHAHLQFVIEAWELIVECRRVLKWTYVYGYYLSLENSRKMNFFGYLQGEAEAALERLHYCAEKEMDKYLYFPCKDFNNFRSKLVGLTAVTRNYFENLVRAKHQSSQGFIGYCIDNRCAPDSTSSNLKVGTVLLSCTFLYDMFWVFVSKWWFHKSVMMVVARGDGSGEDGIPMLLKIPQRYDWLSKKSLKSWILLAGNACPWFRIRSSSYIYGSEPDGWTWPASLALHRSIHTRHSDNIGKQEVI